MRYRILVLSCLTMFLSAALITTAGAEDADRISISELTRMQTTEPVVIIDTRTQSQWQHATDKIPGAVRLENQNDLQQFIFDIGPRTAIVTYCT